MLTLYIRTLLLKHNYVEIEHSVVKDEKETRPRRLKWRWFGGKDKVGSRGRTTNSNGLVKNHMETLYCRISLKYIN